MVSKTLQEAKDTSETVFEKPGKLGRTCILVLGMHRSGTSAMTRVLSYLGAALPENLLGANSYNEAGHWEPARLVELHDWLLAEGGSHWDDWRSFDPGDLPQGRQQYYRQQVAQIMKSEYGDAPLIVVKDPRICRFAPLFAEAVRAVGYDLRVVLVVRNPLEVCASLEARDSMDPVPATLLWLRHVLDAEAASRNIERAIVTYDRMLADWRASVEYIGEALSIEWPTAAEDAGGAIEEFLTPSLRHHVHTLENLQQNKVLHGWVGNAFEALTQIAQSTEVASQTAELDLIRSEFEDSSFVLSHVRRHQQESSERREEELLGVLSEKTSETEALALKISERDARIAELETKEATRILEITSARQLVAEKEAELMEFRRRAEEHEEYLIQTLERTEKQEAARAEDVATQLAEREAEIRALRNSTSWRLTAPLRRLRELSTYLSRSPGGGDTQRSTQVFRLNRAITRAAVKVVDRVSGNELNVRMNGLKQMVSFEKQPAKEISQPFDASCLRIVWIIPDFQPGAGGHMIIFKIAHYLESFGHSVTFIIQNPQGHKTPEEALQTVNSHFVPLKATFHFLNAKSMALTGDCLIATDRFTCYPANAMSGFRRKFYFVLDYETLFYPTGTEGFLTEKTYRMGFDCICGGEWLAKLMGERYGLWAKSFSFGYDSTCYFTEDTSRKPNSIAFYARYVTPRRAVELGLLALEILRERGVDFTVEFFGWDVGQLDVKYQYRNHGVLSAEDLGKLYRSATIGVAFSATNHSLVTREMMACGLPVVDFDLPNVRDVFQSDCVQAVMPDPGSIADGIEALLQSAERRKQIVANAFDEISGVSWETSARVVEECIVERISEVAGFAARK